MSELQLTRTKQLRRQNRTRSRINGTVDRPRLSVKVSNRHIIAQIINDDEQKTLVFLTSGRDKKMTGTMTERAAAVGAELGKQAKAKKIKKVVFDRGAQLYHGRVKALADAARENGLEF